MNTSWTRYLVVLAMALTPGITHAQTRAPEPGEASELRAQLSQGTYRYVGGDVQRAQVEDAIARAVAPMNFIKRRVARGRLRARNAVVQTIDIRFPGNSIEVAFDGRNPWRSPSDGSNAPGRAITGDALRVSQRFHNGRLVQVLASDEGERRDEFAVRDNGAHMTMFVTITSPQLSSPMRYQLDYGR